jgi:formate hydrogenlyase transcriptional activator
MPSLRERADDIPLLVEYFIGRFGKKAGKKFRTIDKKIIKLFEAYQWPGNIRELQNVIERAVILSDGDIFFRGRNLAQAGSAPICRSVSCA